MPGGKKGTQELGSQEILIFGGNFYLKNKEIHLRNGGKFSNTGGKFWLGSWEKEHFSSRGYTISVLLVKTCTPWQKPIQQFSCKTLETTNLRTTKNDVILVHFWWHFWILNVVNILKTCGATWSPEFPRTEPDRIETGPGSGNISKNVFGSVRGILFWVGLGRGIFLPG